MKSKKSIYWIIFIVAQLVILEVILQISVWYFNIHSRYTLATVHYLHVVSRSIEKPVKTKDVYGIGIWQTHPRRGYTHIPSASGKHNTLDFDVAYNIDADGNRAAKKPENPKGHVIFLGGSMTFGHGVEDSQSYPALLQNLYWPKFEVINKGVVGYGTMQSYMTLLEELKSDNPPSVAVYAFIPHHIVRNYIRRSWVSVLDKNELKHPHFEIKKNKLQFQGLIGLDESLEDGPEVTKRELELTSAYIVAMHEECKKKNIPFVVLLLPTHDPYQEKVISTIFDNDILFLDQSQGRFEGFLTDEHLNVEDYAALAKALSKSIISKKLENKKANK
jgi:hypothetical protein